MFHIIHGVREKKGGRLSMKKEVKSSGLATATLTWLELWGDKKGSEGEGQGEGVTERI